MGDSAQFLLNKNEEKTEQTSRSREPPTISCRTNLIRSVCVDAKRATERVFTQNTHNFLDCASFERQRLSSEYV